MRKLFLLIICLLGGSVYSVNAQLTPAQVREAEWKNYALPQTNFTRQTNADKDLVFRVPADWKQQGTELTFAGPHAATIRVFVQKIPDGYSLPEYLASFLQAVKDVPGAAEITITRKTQIQDMEAREIFIELPDPDGEIIRRTSWIVVNGPQAVVFNLQVPWLTEPKQSPSSKQSCSR